MRRAESEDAPRPPRRRTARSGRTWLLIAGVVLFVVLTSLQGIATFYTDYLWFGTLDLSSVWSGLISVKVGLVAGFTTLFFVLMLANLVIADRLAPKFRPMGPDDEIVARYQETVGPHAGKVRLGIAALFALIAGTGASGQWQSWILYRNAVEFGADDPQFGMDVGFFVFQLPFLTYVIDWLFVALVLVLLMTAVAHYLNGGIRLQTPGQRATPQVKAHLSVLLGLLALVKTADYWYRRYELVFSSRGPVDGATYTDVNAQLPALNLLLVISLAAVALFVANIWMRGWVLPVIAVATWGLVAILVGGVYPAFVQKFQVEPDEASKERQYIERNIAATRAALRLDNVTQRDFQYGQDLSAADLRANEETIKNIRLWDPPILRDTYKRLQELRDFFRFNDVDVDRYEIDGELTQVVLSARDLDPDGLPSQRQSWVNKHLQFTHGYGAVLSPANAVTREGQPDFLVSNVPPESETGAPEITQPEIYFGENLGGYAIVNTDQGEIDYITTEGTDRTSKYQGAGGVELSSPLRRAALALRLREINLMISGSINDSSKAIFRRDIRDRASAAAPFLRFDSDPYPVVVDGRIKWILDAYTTTSRYPYAQNADVSDVPRGDLRSGGFNYIRNSVKVVVDAYDGTTTYYIVDDTDPLVSAYAKAFPAMFTPGDEVPDELRKHFRYPEDLFRVQTSAFGSYHIDSASDFYSRSDAWEVSPDPGSGKVQAGTNSGGSATTAPSDPAGLPTPLLATPREKKMDPYYLLMRLPEAEREEFLLMQPFVPFSRDDSRKELTAFMVAKSDPENYGQLEVFVMPRDQQIDGPAIIASRIQQAPDISEQITLLSQSGSDVLLGNLLVIPVEDSLVHVQPMYVQARSTPVPEFKFAIVVYGDQVVMRPTLKDALAVIFGDAPDTLEEGLDDAETPPVVDPGDGVTVSATVLDLLDQAAAAFDQAQQALANGDLGGYQLRIREAEVLVARARAASRASGGTTTTSTTSAPPNDA